MMTMKYIHTIVTWAALLTACLAMTSCLHDDKEIFDKSAAERIAEAVAKDKAILEAAPNGWHMVLWTAQNYGGGGYNMYMKFKGGKVEIKGDIAPATMTVRSSYDVIKDQGPVLTFNTYNEIIHYMANPSATLLDGNGGDYEFVIQSATAEKIVLKGRKSHNIMEMTPVPANVNIEDAITREQANARAIAGYFGEGGDQFIVDPSTRRFYPMSRNTAINYPYVPTTTGIKISGVEGEMTWDATQHTLSYEGETYHSAQPEGYISIDSWVGEWDLRYVNASSGGYDNFRLTLEPTEDLINQQALGALTGKFQVDEYTFDLIVYYSPVTGRITIPAQYIDDPTDTYGMFLVLGCNAYADDLSWYAVDWYTQYDKTEGKYKLVGDSSSANGIEMNTMMMLAVDNNGNLIGNSEGQAISLVTLMFPDYLTPVTAE